MTTEMILSICLGIGLAASSGFRVFVPLFGMSLASYFGILPLGESWLWLGSTTALVILVVASIVESVSYLVPFVDNLLDTIAVPLAGMAGTIAMAGSLTDMSPAMTWALAIVAGGGAAATIKTTTAGARAVSTATTAGVANPVIAPPLGCRHLPYSPLYWQGWLRSWGLWCLFGLSLNLKTATR